MSYHEKLIDLQEQNLFDLPIQNSDMDMDISQSGGSSNEELKNSIMAETEMKINQKFDEINLLVAGVRLFLHLTAPDANVLSCSDLTDFWPVVTEVKLLPTHLS